MSADDGVTPGGSAGRGNRHQQVRVLVSASQLKPLLVGGTSDQDGTDTAD